MQMSEKAFLSMEKGEGRTEGIGMSNVVILSYFGKVGRLY